MYNVQVPKLWIVGLLLIISCKSSQPISQSTNSSPSDPDVKVLYESPWLGFRGADPRYVDLLHTRLELEFDWNEKKVLGAAQLILTPYFYSINAITLDAKDYDIHAVNQIIGSDTVPAEFDYDSQEISILLDRKYTKGERIFLGIDYTANPYRNSSPENRGMYFINADESNPFIPRQIWTQGETEFNSYWFPTLDQPNEKCTHDIILTVDEELETISNGRLTSSQTIGDGKRRDHWKMDQPNPIYLFSVVVGDFKVVQDSAAVPVKYFVDKDFQDADRVFGNTPEMISFFSEKFDYPFPWPKYDQVVVKQFITGAMENTSASTFMDDLHTPKGGMNGESWDYIIAHELAHQWFGDMVTCESWSNIALNESFSNFSEWLWIEHKYGKEEASFQRTNALETYLLDSKEDKFSLVRNFYESPEDVFDSHSYEKGAGIIEMLRNYLGEEAFFAGLTEYLKVNAFKSVEHHDLRQAMESVSGEDLTWFFSQWFETPGHPILDISHRSQDDTLYISIEQIQDIGKSTLYYLPLHLDVFYEGNTKRYPLQIWEQNHEFKLPLQAKAKGLIVDGDYQLVGEVLHEKSLMEWMVQLKSDHSFGARYDAISNILLGEFGSDEKCEAIEYGLQDPSPRIKQLTLDLINSDTTVNKNSFKDKIKEMLEAPEDFVRISAMEFCYDSQLLTEAELRGYLNDSTFYIRGIALQTLLEKEPEEFGKYFERFESANDISTILPLALYLNDSGMTGKYGWYEEKILRADYSGLYFLISMLSDYLLKAPEAEKMEASDLLFSIGSNHYNSTIRLAAFTGLILLEETQGVKNKIGELKNTEKDPELSEIFLSY